MVAQARPHPGPAVGAALTISCVCLVLMSWRVTAAMTGAANRSQSRERDRVHGMVSAIVTAGIDAGYLVNPRLAKVHWQAAGRLLSAPAVSTAGESAQWVGPAEIPSDSDVVRLGRALSAGARGDLDELMASVAAYTGVRWGELTDLTVSQVHHQSARVIAVDRKVVEVAGHLFIEAPKNRKHRKTIHPRRTPGGYPLAELLAARLETARAEQADGTNQRSARSAETRLRSGWGSGEEPSVDRQMRGCCTLPGVRGGKRAAGARW